MSSSDIKPHSGYRRVNSVWEIQRFAFLHKTDGDDFGLLEAVSFADARRHLGSRFWIKSVWLCRPLYYEFVFRPNMMRRFIKKLFINKENMK